jgi:3-deoxy-D-manno-octulosonate 8-phosphate phosphatase (KDO 8-P phosphatase)
MKGRTSIPRADWARIRLFAMDVDGVLTDGTVLVLSDRTEGKRFSVLDGLGLGLVRDAGIAVAWISGRASGATSRRAAELRIETVLQGRRDKLAALTEVAAAAGVGLKDCLYMGDDVIDAPAIRAAGLGVSVPAGMPAAIAAARYVTRRGGGAGAVREVCDQLLAARTPRPARGPRRAAVLLPLLLLLAGAAPRLPAEELTVAPPARNWSMNLFSPEGYHTMNLGGSEVRPVGTDRIDVVNMNIIVFTGGAAPRVESVITSPAATFLVGERIAHGDQTVRLIRDDAEVTGLGWTFYMDQKRVSIRSRARVTFQAVIPDLLK